MDNVKVWTGDRIAVGSRSGLDRKWTWKMVISRGHSRSLVWICGQDRKDSAWCRRLVMMWRQGTQADTWAHQTYRVNFVYVLPISDDRDGMSLAIYWNLAKSVDNSVLRKSSSNAGATSAASALTPIAWHHLSFPELRRELARINGSSHHGACVSVDRIFGFVTVAWIFLS